MGTRRTIDDDRTPTGITAAFQWSRAPARGRFVLVCLAWLREHAATSPGTIQTLAELTGFRPRTVARHLRHLEALGEVRIERRSGAPARYVNTLGCTR
jgi:hypothetical protein